MTRERLKAIAFWITTIFGPTSFVIGGLMNLTQPAQAAVTLQHLGYPVYFRFILGVGNLLGAILITAPGLPRLKEWAYAGFFFNLTAAAFSRWQVGDGAGDIIAPLGFLAMCLASYALRPQSRDLVNSSSG